MRKTTIYHAGILFFQLTHWPRYYISRCGQVLSTVDPDKPEILLGGIQNKGYLQVGLATGGGRVKRLLVHRLVALTFLEPVPGKPQVDHKDANRLNNHVGNLEWVNNQENTRRAREMKLTRFGQRRLPFWK